MQKTNEGVSENQHVTYFIIPELLLPHLTSHTLRQIQQNCSGIVIFHVDVLFRFIPWQPWYPLKWKSLNMHGRKTPTASLLQITLILIFPPVLEFSAFYLQKGEILHNTVQSKIPIIYFVTQTHVLLMTSNLYIWCVYYLTVSFNT